MRRISTTNRPRHQITVTDAEYLDLARQGLVHEGYELAEDRVDAERETPEPEVGRPGTDRALQEQDVPAEGTAPEVTPERKVRNRRPTTPGDPEPPRNQKEI